MKGVYQMIKVIFVCLGNICRSPMAEAVFRKLVEDASLEKQIVIDSAGTSGWHIGADPHEGTLEILKKYQISAAGMKGRAYTKDDLNDFDYIVALDTTNKKDIEAINGVVNSQHVFRLLDLVPTSEIKDVPDPYYTGDFEETYDLVTKGCTALLNLIKGEKNI